MGDGQDARHLKQLQHDVLDGFRGTKSRAYLELVDGQMGRDGSVEPLIFLVKFLARNFVVLGRDALHRGHRARGPNIKTCHFRVLSRYNHH